MNFNLGESNGPSSQDIPIFTQDDNYGIIENIKNL